VNLNLLKTLTLWLLTLTIVSGCSDFNEMKSSKLHDQAQRLIEQGETYQAEKVLADLVAKYPGSRLAGPAAQQQQKLQRQRIQQEEQLYSRLLNSYRQVFDGYLSLYGDYPDNLENFDSSGYYSDSDYLAEIIGDKMNVYLWLPGDKRGFLLWCLHDEPARGFQLIGNSAEPTPFERQQGLVELENRYRVAVRKGNLRILQPGT